MNGCQDARGKACGMQDSGNPHPRDRQPGNLGLPHPGGLGLPQGLPKHAGLPLPTLQQVVVLLQLSAEHKQHELQERHFLRHARLDTMTPGQFDERRRREVQADLARVASMLRQISIAVTNANKKLLGMDLARHVRKVIRQVSALLKYCLSVIPIVQLYRQ